MNANWLAQLAPERAPPAPGWWPPAPGWWALSAATLLIVAACLLWWRNPRRRLRRKALGELQRIYASETDVALTARAIQNLLRRYALAVFGRDGVARLHGNAWLRFVAVRGGDRMNGAIGQSLLRASFGGTLSEDRYQDREAWFAAAEKFLRRARPSGKRTRPQ